MLAPSPLGWGCSQAAMCGCLPALRRKSLWSDEAPVGAVYALPALRRHFGRACRRACRREKAGRGPPRAGLEDGCAVLLSAGVRVRRLRAGGKGPLPATSFLEESRSRGPCPSSACSESRKQIFLPQTPGVFRTPASVPYLVSQRGCG